MENHNHHEHEHHDDHNHDHEHKHNDRPTMLYKWVFTIIFIPACLFAVSHYIFGQVFLRGQSYTAYNMDQDAVRLYKKAIFINRKGVDSRDWLGYSYRMLKNYPEAINAYKKALSIEPDNAKLNYDIGLSYAINGEYKNAITHFEKYKDLILKDDNINPKEKNLIYKSTTDIIATCYKKLGDNDKAQEILLEYQKNNLNNLKASKKENNK